MSTKSEIIRLGDAFIKEKGFNGFSFSDISKKLGIKNASIHYYFPTKSDLGVAIINDELDRLHNAINEVNDKDPDEQLRKFLSIYISIKDQNNICIVGSLASDLSTLDEYMAAHLKILVTTILNWVTAILQNGLNKGTFKFEIAPRTKALLIITNMLASLQLTRLTAPEDFETIHNTILKELKP